MAKKSHKVKKIDIKQELGIAEAERIENTDEISAKNLKEEIKEILEPCVRCGMCKSLCPVFSSVKQEEISPRGKSILLSSKECIEK